MPAIRLNNEGNACFAEALCDPAVTGKVVAYPNSVRGAGLLFRTAREFINPAAHQPKMTLIGKVQVNLGARAFQQVRDNGTVRGVQRVIDSHTDLYIRLSLTRAESEVALEGMGHHTVNSRSGHGTVADTETDRDVCDDVRDLFCIEMYTEKGFMRPEPFGLDGI